MHESKHCFAVAPVAIIVTRRRDERGRIFWSVALASLLVTLSCIIGYSGTSRAGDACTTPSVCCGQLSESTLLLFPQSWRVQRATAMVGDWE